METKTMEKRLVRLFQTKARIVDQVEQQTRLFDKNLATKLLIDGISPPSWLLASDHLGGTGLNAEDLISEVFLSRPQFKIPFSSSHCPVFEEAVAEANNVELPNGLTTEECAQNDDLDAGVGNSALPSNPVDNTGLASAPISAPDEDPSIFSPRDQRETKFVDDIDELPQSLASFHRSRSRQKALELRSSAKVPKCQFDEENSQSGGGVKESAIEKVNLAIPLDTNTVIPAVEAADFGGLWSKNSDNAHSGRMTRSKKSSVVREDDAMLAHSTAQSTEQSNLKNKLLESASDFRISCQIREMTEPKAGDTNSKIEVIGKSVGSTRITRSQKSVVVREDETMLTHSTAQSLEQSNRKNQLLGSVNELQISSQNREMTEAEEGDRDNIVKGKSVASTSMTRSRSFTQQNRSVSELVVVNSASDNCNSRQEAEIAGVREEDPSQQTKSDSINGSKSSHQSARSSPIKKLELSAIVGKEHSAIQMPEEGHVSLASTLESVLEAEQIGINNSVSTTPLLATPNGSFSQEGANLPAERSMTIQQRGEPCVANSTDCLDKEDVVDECVGRYKRTEEDVVDEFVGGYLRTEPTITTEVSPKLSNRRVTRSVSAVSHKTLEIESSNTYESIIRDMSPIIDLAEQPCTSTSKSANLEGKETEIDPDISTAVEPRKLSYDNPEICRFNGVSSVPSRNGTNGRSTERTPTFISESASLQANGVSENCPENHSFLLNEKNDISVEEEPQTDLTEALVEDSDLSFLALNVPDASPERDTSHAENAIVTHERQQSDKNIKEKSSLTGMKESRRDTLQIEDCDLSNALDFLQPDLYDNHNENRRSLAQETEDLVISEGVSAEFRSSYCDPNVDCLEPNHDQIASTSVAKPSYCSPVEDLLTRSKRRRIDLRPDLDCSPEINESSVLQYDKDFLSSNMLHEGHTLTDIGKLQVLQVPKDVVHQTEEHNTQEGPESLSALKFQEVYFGLEERNTSNGHDQDWSKSVMKHMKSNLDGTVESLHRSLKSPQTQSMFFSELEGFVMQSDDDEQLCRVDKISFDDIDHNGILEQLCKSACIKTPLTSSSTPHTLHKVSYMYQSVPTGLLENLDMQNKHMNSDEFASALQGRAHSDSFPTSTISHDWDIKKPCLSPVRKVWDRVVSRSGSSERRVSSNPELPCINEESENIEDNAETFQYDSNETIASSVKRKPLGGIDENIPESEVEPYADRFSMDSLNTEFSLKKKSKKGKNMKRRYNNKENESLSRNGNMGSLQNRISKQQLSTRTSSRIGVSSSTVMEPKRSNIVSNITSFIPLVQQKQAAAVPTGKRDVKVRALEAAEAAKRQAEKKENDRKIKKEAMKLERARQEQENIKQLEQQKKQKEEERKKKEAIIVAKKRQREEEERKEKEKKRQRVEESRKQQKENEQKLQAAKEEKVKVNEQKLQAAKDERERVNDQKLQAAKDEKEKLRSSVVTCLDKPRRTDSIVAAPSEEPSYDISPYKCSDDEAEEDDDDDRPNTKFIPSWATKNAILVDILLQDKKSFKTVFHPKSFCSIDEVLLPRRIQKIM